ncbi:phage tail domain-containing protein [Fructilactobacillus sp. Tb1]|uniref:phage tail domain-containing protein n=1 Tax=Fructilactobacillus sp. Tb1 TaxID=3422304 RepID=UPI003D2CACAF
MSSQKLFISIDGNNEFDLDSLVNSLHFISEKTTPILSNTYQDSNGTDGHNFNLASFQNNTSTITMSFHFSTYQDYLSKKQVIYNAFLQKKIYRIRTSNEPMFVRFVRPVGFDIEPYTDGANDCIVTIPFENPSGYKYSRYDSLNQSDLWDDYNFNFDLPIMDREDFHFHNQHNFKIYNPSGIPIDPYTGHDDLKIIASYIGGIFGIGNNNNGTSYELKVQSDGTDQIVVDGMNTYINGSLNNNLSNFGNLKLEPGWNDIWTSMTTNDVKLEFPFIYI